jgi:hypothetical protein
MVYLILVTINVWHVIVLNLWNNQPKLYSSVLLLSIGDFTKPGHLTIDISLIQFLIYLQEPTKG